MPGPVADGGQAERGGDQRLVRGRRKVLLVREHLRVRPKESVTATGQTGAIQLNCRH